MTQSHSFRTSSLRGTSVFYLIRPSKDGERENARWEPCVQNIFIYNRDRTDLNLQIDFKFVKRHTRRPETVRGFFTTITVVQNNSKKKNKSTLSEGNFVCRNIEALRGLLPGFVFWSAAHPVMTVHVLEWGGGASKNKYKGEKRKVK